MPGTRALKERRAISGDVEGQSEGKRTRGEWPNEVETGRCGSVGDADRVKRGDGDG
jgi:hypothetical protein